LARNFPPVFDFSISARMNSDSRETDDILDRSRLFFYEDRVSSAALF
jgi:hypothetical protein